MNFRKLWFSHLVGPGKCQFDPSHEGGLRGRILSQDERFMVSIIFSDNVEG